MEIRGCRDRERMVVRFITT